MKFLSWIVLLIMSPIFLTAQISNSQNPVNRKTSPVSFNQNSVALFGLNFNENLSYDVYSELIKLQVPQKYGTLQIDYNIIESELLRSAFSEPDEKKIDQQLEQLLNKNKVGHQILSEWFNRQPDSSFNLDILKQHGFTNESIEDLFRQTASKKGRLKLMDSGLKMVNQTYLMIFDFEEIKSMKEYYKEKEVKKQYQYLNGFISNVNCYIVKFDFNGSVASTFFHDFWISENDLERRSKINAFENAEFPFIPVKKYRFEITSAQHNQGHPLAPEKQKTEGELLQNLAELALGNVLNDLDSQKEPFSLKTKIQDVGPIAAGLGNKGGLKFDQRYFVYENRIRKTGKVYEKRVGVIKSNKIIDTKNDSITTAQNSAFYQIAGNPIYSGMYLKKSNDIGLNLFAGNAFNGLPGFTGRIEYYFSKMFGDLITPGKSALGATSVKIYLSGGYNRNSYAVDELLQNHTFKRGSFGISKDFYPFRLVHWGPYLGYGLETVKWTGSKNTVSSNFAEMGMRLGVNITYNIQLVASYNYYHFFNSILLDQEREVLDENFQYQNNYSDRAKSGISMGVRVML